MVRSNVTFSIIAPPPCQGGIAVEQIGAAPQAADAGRAVEFVAGESVEIAADRGDVDRHARHRLAAVEQQQRALRMRDFGGALGVEDRAERVRHMRERDDAMLVR